MTLPTDHPNLLPFDDLRHYSMIRAAQDRGINIYDRNWVKTLHTTGWTYDPALAYTDCRKTN